MMIRAVILAPNPAGRFAKYEELDDQNILAEAKRLGLIKPDSEDPLGRVRARSRFLDQVRESPELLKSRGAARQVIASLPSDKDAAVAFLCAFAFSQQDEPSWDEAVRLTLALAATDPSVSAADVAADVLILVQAKQLSLLTDKEVQWTKSGNALSMHSVLQVRYVRGEVRATSAGLSRPDKATEHAEAGAKATELLPRLEPIYPALAQTKQHAAWIALMRWALVPGNVDWLDLADLIATNHQNVQTPDYLCQEGKENCLEEIGADER